MFLIHSLSDNVPHYHNTGLLVYLAEVGSAFNLTLVEYNNFEAGEGKTVLDTHFAHISHKIVRWVRVGNNLETREQLADLVMVSCHQLSLFTIISITSPTIGWLHSPLFSQNFN